MRIYNMRMDANIRIDSQFLFAFICMIRIGVDARSLEGERTGVGRYLYELLKEWKQNALSQAQFYLYFKKEIPSDIAKDFTAPAFILKRLPTFFGRPSNAFFLHIAFPWALRNDRTAH